MKLTLFLLVMLFSGSGFAMHIIVDAGHGGSDNGAHYYNLKEKHITLQVAKHLKELLQKDKDFKVSLTRTTDKFMNPSDRAEKAFKLKGDLFISLHVNAFDRPHTRGAEFYFQNQLPPDEEAMFLANKENQSDHIIDGPTSWPLKPVRDASQLKPEVISIVQDLQRNYRIKMSSQLAEELYQNWQGLRRSPQGSIKQAPFYVVENVNMPSTLIEMGFLSNRQEAQKLNSPAYQKQLAKGIYEAIRKFKDFIDKKP